MALLAWALPSDRVPAGVEWGEQGIVTGGGAGLDNAARRAILASLDRFIRDRLVPRAKEIDATAEFPRDLYKAVGELGIFGLWTPAEFGGISPDLVTPLLAAERLARVSVAFSLSVSNMGDCMVPLATAGSDWAKRIYLSGMARGEIVPCLCLSEPSGGSDVAAKKTHARRWIDRRAQVLA